MTTSSIRRQMKNIVHNYTPAEVKVREATSNDPWGPSPPLMSEIADLTYDPMTFGEVMGMIWKRLNDYGKNWRHVSKALTLLEYLVKTGSERVVQQCRENLVSVQTLRDFQYVDRDGCDQGATVRDKARQLTALIRDETRLQQERSEALGNRGLRAANAPQADFDSQPPPYPSINTSGQYGQSFGSPVSYSSPSPSSLVHIAPDLEQARPQTTGEEELQLQLALAMSREESEKPPPTVDDEEAQLQIALSLSKEEAEKPALPPPVSLDIDEETQLEIALRLSKEEHQQEQWCRQGDESLLQRALEESKLESDAVTRKHILMDQMNIFKPITPEPPSSHAWDLAQICPVSHPDPWDSLENCSSTQMICKPWVAPPAPSSSLMTGKDPWENPQKAFRPSQASVVTSHTGDSCVDPFSVLTEDNPDMPNELSASRSGSPTDGDLFGEPLGKKTVNGGVEESPEFFGMSCLEKPLTEVAPRTRNKAEAFLGPTGATLVDLDNLIPSSSPAKATNPFLLGAKDPLANNPFQAKQPPQTLNMRPGSASSVPYSTSLPLPLSHTPAPLPSSLTQPPTASFLPQPFSSAPFGGTQSSDNPFL